MTDEKIVKSQHIFLFPFRIDFLDEKKAKSTKHTDFVKAILDTIKSPDWIYKAYNPKESTCYYNEYFYFHDYVQKAIFDIREYEDIKDKQESVVSYYFEKDKCQTYKMSIFVKIENDSIRYDLDIENISLRIFETGVGILTIVLFNHEKDSIDDILKINDFGRRIYPQFLPVDSTKGVFLADKIILNCNGHEIIEDFAESRFHDSKLQIAKYIRHLIGDELYTNFKLIPSIDDRMYTVCWYSNDSWSKEFSEKNAYKSCDEWYKFIFIDGNSIGVANNTMKRELIKKNTYARWVEWGTFYGITRYSLMCLTNSGFLVSRKHMLKQYYQIAIITLAQRASILKFSSDISKITERLEEIDKASDNKENNFDEIVQEIKELNKRFIRFTNRLCFTEVTPQEQGIEMYNMAVDVMGLKQQVATVKEEMKELYEFVELNYAKFRNNQMEKLNKIVFMFLPITVVTGLWGMNLFFINLFAPELNEQNGHICKELCILILTLGLFAISVIISYRIAINLNNTMKNDDKFAIEGLLKCKNLKYIMLENNIIWWILFLVVAFIFIVCV